MNKIVLIGANHAGTAAVNVILDHYKNHEVIVFDQNSNISYLGCGTALWVGKQIDGPEKLFYSTPEIMKSKNAKVYMQTAVENIDFDKKTVYAKDNLGNEITESYDKLILATGSLPILPKIPGTNLDNVQFVKLFQDGQKIFDSLENSSIKNVAIIGAGYIGVELAEAAKRRGCNSSIYEIESTCLTHYYDAEFTHDMDQVLKEKQIRLNYNQEVLELKGKNGKVTQIITSEGAYPADLVLMAIGFKPNAILGRNKLERFSNGAYKVDLQQRTSIPDVYAIGDCATVFDNARQQINYIALATNAVRSGIIAAHNICGTPLSSPGVQGSNGISIFGYNMVSTGMSVHVAQKAGFDVKYTDYEDLQKPEFIKEKNESVKIRIVYEKSSRRIIGAQMASYYDISMGIHVFSLAIEEQVTIDKLKLLDIFFLPHFNQPYNYITMAALLAK